MTQDLEPLVKVKFQILFCRATQKAASPATTSAMCYGLAYRPTGGEEEKIDMGVDLADDTKVYIEV